MLKNIKYFYYVISLLFFAFTMYELFIYIRIDSNYFGLFYLILNFFLSFMLFSISKNFNYKNKSIRVSKNFIVSILGFFSSFLLIHILTHLFLYSDSSLEYVSLTFIVSKVLKPIIYFLLLVSSILEVKIFK